MATDILFTDVTEGTITGNGYFDKLMASLKTHIQAEYSSGRIKGTDYATVYLGALQSAMAQAIQFALQEKQVEAQVDLSAAELKLKEAALLNENARILMEAVAQYGYNDASIDTVTGKLTLGVRSDTDGIVNQQELGLVKENLLKDDQLLTTAKQRLSIDKDIDVKERSMLEQEATGAKQRMLLDTEEEAKQYEVDFILPQQKTKLEEEIDLLQTQDANLLKDTAIDIYKAHLATYTDLYKNKQLSELPSALSSKTKLESELTDLGV